MLWVPKSVWGASQTLIYRLCDHSDQCPCLDVVIVGGANLLRLRVPHNQQETGPGGQQLLPLRPSGDEPL